VFPLALGYLLGQRYRWVWVATLGSRLNIPPGLRIKLKEAQIQGIEFFAAQDFSKEELIMPQFLNRKVRHAHFE
jgi:hypothetical protein